MSVFYTVHWMGKNNKTRKSINPTQRLSKTYSVVDYESNNGMLTTVWGPSMWHTLHAISFNYPVNPSNKEKQHYRNYILSLKHILPCGKCRKNFSKNLKTLPLTMSSMKSRDTFSKYIYELHEVVNGMLGKHSGLTYDDVRERYEHFRSRCTISLGVKTRKHKKYIEDGCTEPLIGEKSKCILKIIPNDEKCETFQIDNKCIKKKMQ